MWEGRFSCNKTDVSLKVYIESIQQSPGVVTDVELQAENQVKTSHVTESFNVLFTEDNVPLATCGLPQFPKEAVATTYKAKIFQGYFMTLPLCLFK